MLYTSNKCMGLLLMISTKEEIDLEKGTKIILFELKKAPIVGGGYAHGCIEAINTLVSYCRGRC